MENITKPHELSLNKLGNTEYTYFSQQVASFIPDAATLHLDTANINYYKANIIEMAEMIVQSHHFNKTSPIIGIDKKTNDLIHYLFTVIRISKSSPMKAQHIAGTLLHKAIYPYIGLQRLPQRQEVQQTCELLTDLSKLDMRANIKILGLTDVISSLEETIDEYVSLIDNCANEQIIRALETERLLRLEMNEQYENIVTTVFAFNIALPTKETAEFITRLNKLIDDTKAAYHQRLSQTNTTMKKKIGI